MIVGILVALAMTIHIAWRLLPLMGVIAAHVAKAEPPGGVS